MAFGKRNTGGSDPEAIIAKSAVIQEFELQDLLELQADHKSEIGILTMLLKTPDSSDLNEVAKVSDRLQFHTPTDDANIIEVIDILSSNAGYYEDAATHLTSDKGDRISLENLIESDPLIQTLMELKTDSRHARTLRLWRSILAITYVSTQTPHI